MHNYCQVSYTPAYVDVHMQLECVCVSAHNNTEIALVFKQSVHEVHGVEVSELLLFLKIIFRQRCSKLRGDLKRGLRVLEVEDLGLCVQEFK